MSVPHSNILSCSRGVLAKTDVGYCSPKQSQNSSSYTENNVKVVVYLKNETQNENPYAQNETPDESKIKERSIDTAKETLTNLQQIIKNKDMLIQALVLSLDIIQNNPLIINKYVIADEHELALLIKYLTDAEEVDIIKNDHECSCSVSKKYDIISRIMIKKNNEIYNLKYSYPDVNQYLYDRKFSTKFIKPTVSYEK